MIHIPVLLQEILKYLPTNVEKGWLLDVTAGAGGHFFAMLKARVGWQGVAIDQDSLARQRIAIGAREQGLEQRVHFYQQNFSSPPPVTPFEANFILADLGVSSFQLDDHQRGMSFHSDVPPDFRMNLDGPHSFYDWVQNQSEASLVRCLEDFGEEPKARQLARALKNWSAEEFQSSKHLADRIAQILRYPNPSRKHPATRAFQAFRMAINDELGVLDAFLMWAPQKLASGGRLAVITFHSLEDRIVKNRFRDLENEGSFKILTKRALSPGDAELHANPRARSSKLRVIERTSASLPLSSCFKKLS